MLTSHVTKKPPVAKFPATSGAVAMVLAPIVPVEYVGGVAADLSTNVAFVPSVAGMIIGGEVIKDLIKDW